MITYQQGNLLESDADALVNTVNTVGVMGKGIALMFKERFPENYRLYASACKLKEVRTGHMFVTAVHELDGPKWIINFPTKQHWRASSQLSWIHDGLADLKKVIVDNQIKSIAVPPLGAGNGGLQWDSVKAEIDSVLSDLSDVEIVVFEPTEKYQNVAKREGVQKLTPARALIAELVRRYWVLGMECSLLEIQKLAWFLERAIARNQLNDPLDLRFEANKYGPYADRLRHLLNGLDGSYLHSDKRISDADPLDVIWFDDSRKDFLQAYMRSEEVRPYLGALEQTADLIDGFETPFGMELLATADWLIFNDGYQPNLESIRLGLKTWKVSPVAAERKSKLFDDRAIEIALKRLTSSIWSEAETPAASASF